MREIKFRALVGGQWFYGDILNWAGEAQIWADGHNFIIKNKETIGQYTGLKDKHGVEIYEGDIVDVVANHHDFGVGVIEWNSQEVRFGVRLDNDTCYIIDGGLDELKVIGNIYENPELLEANQ